MTTELLSQLVSPAVYGRLLAVVLQRVRDRATAEDILQDAWLAVLGNAAFDPSRGPAAVSFLHRKARWLVRDYYRRQARSPAPLSAGLADGRAREPHQSLERSEIQEQVRFAVAELSEAQRAVMVRHLAGMDHEQIAADLAVPVHVVYRHFHAGKENLRRLLRA
jgi:RNA polymerase sigma-70 factor, ECF subfamily